jgi:hypothetical protein
MDEDAMDIFKMVELSVFVELLHHLVGIKRIKRHLFINFLTQSFIVTCVISFGPNVSADFLISITI